MAAPAWLRLLAARSQPGRPRRPYRPGRPDGHKKQSEDDAAHEEIREGGLEGMGQEASESGIETALDRHQSTGSEGCGDEQKVHGIP